MTMVSSCHERTGPPEIVCETGTADVGKYGSRGNGPEDQPEIGLDLKMLHC